MKALRPFLVSLLFRERVCRLALLEMYYNVTKLQLFLLLIMELSACNEKISNRFLHFVLLLSYQPPYVSVCIGMYHFVAPKTDREVESIAPIRLSSYAEGSVEFVWRRCQYVAAGRLEQIMLCWSLTSPNFNTNH